MQTHNFWSVGIDSQIPRNEKNFKGEKDTEKEEELKGTEIPTLGGKKSNIHTNPSILRHLASHQLSTIIRNFQVRFLKALFSGKYI